MVARPETYSEVICHTATCLQWAAPQSPFSFLLRVRSCSQHRELEAGTSVSALHSSKLHAVPALEVTSWGKNVRLFWACAKQQTQKEGDKKHPLFSDHLKHPSRLFLASPFCCFKLPSISWSLTLFILMICPDTNTPWSKWITVVVIMKI